MASELSALGAAAGYGQIDRAKMATPAVEPASDSAIADGAKDFVEVFNKADEAVQALARGEGSAQAVVEAMSQAELALQTAVTIRDRVVEAYQEILRMPV